MKVNNPYIDVTKPIHIKSKDDYVKVSRRLESLGYKWRSHHKLTEWWPKGDDYQFYLHCDNKNKIITSSDYES